jgi:predicted AlkP superfamily pyrophosphatase or phosphodiesterase
MKKIIFVILLGIMGLYSCQISGRDNRKVPYVLVIGIDGLGSHGFEIANTPHLNKLMENGAWTLSARTVIPSRSGPAWSSMITGATVEKHGIGDNGWTVDDKLLEPVIKGDFDMFPTIFGETRGHLSEAVIAAFYHWGKFGDFIEKEVCDVSQSAGSEDSVTTMACKFINERKPDLTFVHLDHVDHAGHHGGYRSEEYTLSIEKADSLVGVFLEQLKRSGIYEETVVFVVSDHGGFEHSHGGIHPDEMIVPFLISGKGVKKGYKIEHPVFIYDLAPTVAYLLGFELNEYISGTPLAKAFMN